MSKEFTFVNTEIAVEQYKPADEGVKKGKSSFLAVHQRRKLYALKAIASANVMISGIETKIQKGDLVFFKQESLESASWSMILFSSPNIDEQFVLAPANAIVAVQAEE